MISNSDSFAHTNSNLSVAKSLKRGGKQKYKHGSVSRHIMVSGGMQKMSCSLCFSAIIGRFKQDLETVFSKYS
jgi:hypothetical protein